MIDNCYIIINRNGITRMVKSDRFTLQPEERAFFLEVEVPDEAFAQPPIPTVRMKIPTEALVREIEVNTGD